MVQEIMTEVIGEITADPLGYLLELAQFAILVFLVYAIAIGIRGRRGVLTGMISDRAVKTSTRLSGVGHSTDELQHAKKLASLRVRTARADARQMLTDARREAAENELKVHGAVEAEAQRVIERVDEALATEEAEMQAEVREELVDLVAQATRQLLNERMSVGEQRRLIEEHVLSSIGAASDVPVVSGPRGA